MAKHKALATRKTTLPGRADLIKAWFSGKAKTTRDGYALDVRMFARWRGMDERAAVDALLQGGQAKANALLHAYRGAMLDDGLATATVARRLAAVRSLVGLARRIGVVNWGVDVERVKVEPKRDPRGPKLAAVRKVLRSLNGSPRGARDRAMIRLLTDCALRVSELVGLDVKHVTATDVSIKGKGKRERQTVPLPPLTRKALDTWLSIRGDEPGPLFVDVRGHVSDRRLTRCGVHSIVKARGLGHPHGLRHAAITAALDASGGDVRRVRSFSRHKSVAMVQRYDDARTSKAAAAEIAAAVSNAVGEGGS